MRKKRRGGGGEGGHAAIGESHLLVCGRAGCVRGVQPSATGLSKSYAEDHSGLTLAALVGLLTARWNKGCQSPAVSPELTAETRMNSDGGIGRLDAFAWMVLIEASCRNHGRECAGRARWAPSGKVHASERRTLGATPAIDVTWKPESG